MKYLKYYEGLSRDRVVIDDFLSDLGISRYKVNRVGVNKIVVHISGSINIDVDLTEFPFRFGRIDGDFIISHNNLVTLNGGPNYVSGNFNCRGNDLKSLEGCPEYVGGDFDCGYNELVSLEGCPSVIGGVFNCNLNKSISSFSGLVSCSRFHCDDTLLNNIWSLFSDVSKLELFNDYDIIRGEGSNTETPCVVLDRLNSFLQDIGKEPVSGVEGYKNI